MTKGEPQVTVERQSFVVVLLDDGVETRTQYKNKDALVADMSDRLSRGDSWDAYVRSAVVADVRSAGRRAGREIGRSIQTCQTRHGDGIEFVCVVLAERTEAELSLMMERVRRTTERAWSAEADIAR